MDFYETPAALAANGVHYPPPPENGSARALGAWGEEVAARYLEASGATVLARNWRCRWGELDLVVREGASIRAVEVKTRRAGGHVPALEAVSPHKYARLRRLLGLWLVQAGMGAPEIAVDLLAVTLRGGAPNIDRVRDI